MADATPRPRNGTGKALKYRASCDSCNEARVRCSQTRPSCARCLKQGLECIYGISLRAGKHRADSFRNNGIASSVRTTAATSNAPSPPETTTALLPLPQSPLEEAELPDCWQQQLKDWGFENFGVPGIPNMVPTHLFDPHHQSLSGGDETQLLQSMRPESLMFPDVQNLGYTEVPDEYNANAITIRKTTGSTSASSPGSNPTSNTRFDAYPSSSNPRIDPGSPTSQHTTHQRDSSQQSTTCRCFELILTQLPQLQSANRPFDIELAQAQEAMSLCARALSCACSRKDYVCVLTVTLLLACVVSVFEREFTSSYNNLGHATPASEDDSMQVDVAPKDRDTTPRFSFGKFQLDVEDEWKLKKEIMWLQIQKVEGLVEAFQEMIRRGNVDREDWAGKGNAWEALAEVLARKVEKLRMGWGARRRA